MTITVYSRDNCVQCEATYRALNKRGIDYNVIDVEKDADAMNHIVGLGFQQLPVVEVKRSKKKAEAWSGYRIDLIKGLKGAA